MARGEQFKLSVNAVYGLENDIYIVDSNVCRVSKVLPDGRSLTIAGTGICDYNGDNILATDACLYSPSAVAVNSIGEVIIADTDNNRIRKILTNGTIITIAGTGNSDYNGDNILATSANLKKPKSIA